ncbi:hypothetical protein [Clostridium estertheticum]|nr:hypothetical protein [Clostridium estertheticum]
MAISYIEFIHLYAGCSEEVRKSIEPVVVSIAGLDRYAQIMK